jgi:hypothetical protein
VAITISVTPGQPMPRRGGGGDDRVAQAGFRDGSFTGGSGGKICLEIVYGG